MINLTYPGYRSVLKLWICVAIGVFFVLLKITAPYGRHSSTKWGRAMNNSWGWLVMELPVLLVLASFIVPDARHLSQVSWILIGLFCLHYVNRCFIFPFRLHTRGKMIPLVIVASAIFFNLINGFSLGYYFTHFAHYTTHWIRDPRFIAGLILFFTGVYINWKADDILIHLRKPAETNYVIPRKWLFEYISCPNLFGELIEWFGFALACWNLPAFTFLIWTAANLIPRALSHHKWYRERFPDYPAKRFAIIPFLL